MKRFNVSKIGSEYEMNVLEAKMRLTRYHTVVLINELEMIQDLYCPIDLSGKKVLDVECGCGETALVFWWAGATKITGIEIDKRAIELAKLNAKNNGMPLEVIEEPFKLEHLAIDHDFLKIDIEGAEALLLNYNGILKPCAIEGHFGLGERIAERFNLNIAKNDGKGLTIVNSTASNAPRS
jgi:SAM-dependent methyltransferase